MAELTALSDRHYSHEYTRVLLGTLLVIQVPGGHFSSVSKPGPSPQPSLSDQCAEAPKLRPSAHLLLTLLRRRRKKSMNLSLKMHDTLNWTEGKRS